MIKTTIYMKLTEAGTVGSTNVVDMATPGDDIGTDTPRLPSYFGNLDGKKSFGMGAGGNEYNTTIYDPWDESGSYQLLTVLNHMGDVFNGDSTTNAPVTHSPYSEYVPDGAFITKHEIPKQITNNDGIQNEIYIRKNAKLLRDELKLRFYNNIRVNRGKATKTSLN